MTMPVSPADVIAGTLRRAGIDEPEMHARAVVADLAGHGLLHEPSQRRRAKQPDQPAPKCQRPADPHSGTNLVSGHCPICGWSPDEDPSATEKTGTRS